MELVQHYRDTNFLLEHPFDDCISPVNLKDKCFNRPSLENTFIVDAYETDWEIFPAPVSDTCLTDPLAVACQLFITDDGKVLHERGGALGENPTKFYRMLTVTRIPLDELEPQTGIKVVVEVKWQEKKAKSIFLVKEFYDWRSLE